MSTALATGKPVLLALHQGRRCRRRSASSSAAIAATSLLSDKLRSTLRTPRILSLAFFCRPLPATSTSCSPTLSSSPSRRPSPVSRPRSPRSLHRRRSPTAAPRRAGTQAQPRCSRSASPSAVSKPDPLLINPRSLPVPYLLPPESEPALMDGNARGSNVEDALRVLPYWPSNRYLELRLNTGARHVVGSDPRKSPRRSLSSRCHRRSARWPRRPHSP